MSANTRQSYRNYRPARRRRNHHGDGGEYSEPFLSSNSNNDYLAIGSDRYDDNNQTPILLTGGGEVELSSYQPPQVYQEKPDTEDFGVIPFFYPSSPIGVNENPARDYANPCLSHGCCWLQCVRTQELGMTEECGRFDRILGPGLHFMPSWPFQTIAGRISLRVLQLDFTCETKTTDHVFVFVTVSILYRVAPVSAYQAYYRLQDPVQISQSAVLDVIRSTVATKLSIDEVFSNYKIINDELVSRLQPVLREYGYEVVTSLVTNIRPNTNVQDAMNEIEASRRWKQAAAHKGEATKVKLVKEAEAKVETASCTGQGIAKSRQAIAAGMRDSVNQFTDVDVRIQKPPSATEVMDLLLVSQYLDVLTHVNADRVFVDHGVSTDRIKDLLPVRAEEG